MMKYFSSSYQKARRKFLEAARSAGASVENFRNPALGPEGEELFTDAVLCGPRDAQSVMVLISATHGIEGFTGSALQTGLLREGFASTLAPGVSILMVHAINPYGFAYQRRFTEDNVDLNRNFGDHSRPYPVNPGYENLKSAISPASISFAANAGTLLELAWYRMKHGKAALRDAVTLGQHTDPTGLFYGGRSETWSNRTLRALLHSYLSKAERVAAVEIHTGLGTYGGAEVILNEGHNSPACRRARRWWGDRARSTEGTGSVSADIRGSAKLALPGMLPNAEVTAVSLEFGTYRAAKVFRALRRENWLHHHGGPEYPEAERIKADLLEAFYPANEKWRAQVWKQGREIVGQALTGLSRNENVTVKKYLSGAEPLYLRGGKRGLLLLHGGGGGTAWDMKEFARTAYQRGFTVQVPSLPGYGTQPSDLIGITVDRWLDEALESVDSLLRDCATVAVVGHSLGGGLALILAAEDRRISRAAAWAAPWKIRNRLLPLLPALSAVPLARRLIPERLPVRMPVRLMEMGWVGYEWLPSSIGFPVLDLLKRLHAAVHGVDCPALVVQGTEDSVIVEKSASEIIKRLPSPDKRIRLIEGGGHLLMQSPAKDDLFRETLDFLE